MPEELSQAAPTGQVIPEGEEVLGQATEQVSAQEEPQTEQPLTLDNVRELIRNEATRIAQSQVAKGENRINARIQEQFKALDMNKSVLGLSDDQVAQARQKIVTDAYVSDQEQDVTQTGVHPQAEDMTPDQFLTSELTELFKEHEVKFTPELMNELQPVIDAAFTDPRGLSKIIRAAEKLATREAERKVSLQEKAQARVVGGGGTVTTGTGKALTPEQKISQGLRSANWNNPSPKA